MTLTARPVRGQKLDLYIETLAFGGDGIARTSIESPTSPDTGRGYVVFVSGALPGDRVRAEVTKPKRHHAHARTLEVLEGAPDRVPPVADHPGAPWQVLPYERQLEVKASQVEDSLRRLGHLDGFEVEPIIPAESTWRYRNKLEYSFGEEDGELVCGFHAPGSWEEIVPIEDCLLASRASNEARETVLAWCREQGLRAWDRRGGGGVLRNLVVREGRRTGALQVRLVTDPALSDDADLEALAARMPGVGVLWTAVTQVGETTLGGRTQLVGGPEALSERLGDLDLLISPTAFFQTNTEMAERLYGVAAEYAALEGWQRVFDLYCGIGTIGLSLAAKAGEVWGLEIAEPAIVDAIANAKRNEVRNARFFAGDIRLALAELVGRAGRPDVLVLDPPRAGLSQKVVRRVIEASPRRIVYVSCNPTTLAPNAAQLAEAGWALKKVRAVDMFPHTPHIECVAVLDRVG